MSAITNWLILHQLYNFLMRGFAFEKIEFQNVFKGRVQATEFIFNKAKLSIREYFS